MIYHILESYFALLFSVGISAALILMLGLYWILRKPKSNCPDNASPSCQINQDTDIEAVLSQTQPVQNTGKDSHHCSSAHTTQTNTKNITITSNDISAIAGDDVLSTQLDLARAYIETGRKQLAKKILEHVANQGTDAQQNEARTLLGLI